MITREEELYRITHGRATNTSSEGILLGYNIETRTSSKEFLRNCLQIWTRILQETSSRMPDIEEWEKILPKWFLEQFGPEISHDEAVRRRNLPIEERLKYAEVWSLSSWLYWLDPSRRFWAWWHSSELSPASAQVVVLVDGIPFPAGSLLWFLRCCGGDTITETTELQI